MSKQRASFRHVWIQRLKQSCQDSFSTNQQCLSPKLLHFQTDHLPHTTALTALGLRNPYSLWTQVNALASILHKDPGSDWVTWPLLNQSQCPEDGDYVLT